MTAVLIKPKWKLTGNKARGVRTLGVAANLLLLKETAGRSPSSPIADSLASFKQSAFDNHTSQGS